MVSEADQDTPSEVLGSDASGSDASGSSNDTRVEGAHRSVHEAAVEEDLFSEPTRTATTDSAPDDPDLREAKRMLAPRFEVKRLLGRGGMGMVVEAYHVALGRNVAVKILPSQESTSAELRERFLREARACGRLNHPNIVTVHDVNETSGYIVMEVVEGETLRQRIVRDRRLPPSEVRRIGIAVLDALAEAHAQGIIHRDVKPGNVLLSSSGQVKLSDFGIAHVMDSELTRTGSYVGTPAYMAPEQLRGRHVDARADVYAVGATLFEALTGEKIHTEHRSIEDPGAYLLERTGDRAVARAVAIALSEKPEQRFADARAFAAALADSEGFASAEVASFRAPLSKAPHIELAPTNLQQPPADSPAEVAERTRTRAARKKLIWWPVGVLGVVGLAVGGVTALRPDASRTTATSVLKRVAMFPVVNETGRSDLGFLEAGLPHLLGEELGKVAGVSVIDYYLVRSGMSESRYGKEAWDIFAREAGADLVLRGRMEAAGERVRLVLRLGAPSTEPEAEWDAVVAAEELPSAAARLAARVAARIVDQDVELTPSDSGFEFQRELLMGIDQLERHRIPEALAHLLAAAKVDPDSGELNHYLAICSWWQEQPAEETARYIDRALASHPREDRRDFLEGLRLLLRREFHRAVPLFQAASAKFPRNRELLYGLYEALYHAGYPAQGIAVYQRLVAMYPSFRLGLQHAQNFALAHFDEPLMKWSGDLYQATGERFDEWWDVQRLLAERKYGEAVVVLKELQSSGHTLDPGDPRAGMVDTAMVNALLLAGEIDRARDESQRLLNAYQEASMQQYAVELVAGDLRAASSARERLLQMLRHEAPSFRMITMWLPAVQMDAIRGEAELVRPLFEEVRARVPKELHSELHFGMAESAMAIRLEERTALEVHARAPYPELEAFAAGGLALLARDYKKAVRHFQRAQEFSADGRHMIFERYFAVLALRADKKDRGVLKECDEIIAPRVFTWTWVSAVGECLLWTAEAHAALGNASEAERLLDRLVALRDKASSTDPIISQARALKATLRAKR